MKKINLNYFLIMSIVVILLGVVSYLFILKARIDKDIKEINESIESVTEDGEVDDVEGYGAIAESAVSFFGMLGSFGIGLMAIILLIYDFILFIFATIAKLSFNPCKELLPYRIFMTIVYGLLGVFAIACLKSFTVTISIFNMLGVLGPVAVILITGINTYTERIRY